MLALLGIVESGSKSSKPTGASTCVAVLLALWVDLMLVSPR